MFDFYEVEYGAGNYEENWESHATFRTEEEANEFANKVLEKLKRIEALGAELYEDPYVIVDGKNYDSVEWKLKMVGQEWNSDLEERQD